MNTTYISLGIIFFVIIIITIVAVVIMMNNNKSNKSDKSATSSNASSRSPSQPSSQSPSQPPSQPSFIAAWSSPFWAGPTLANKTWAQQLATSSAAEMGGQAPVTAAAVAAAKSASAAAAWEKDMKAKATKNHSRVTGNVHLGNDCFQNPYCCAIMEPGPWGDCAMVPGTQGTLLDHKYVKSKIVKTLWPPSARRASAGSVNGNEQSTSCNIYMRAKYPNMTDSVGRKVPTSHNHVDNERPAGFTFNVTEECSL